LQAGEMQLPKPSQFEETLARLMRKGLVCSCFRV
jgi:hypothetical protein